MSDDMRAEMQHWQARCDEMQVAIERLREERDFERSKNATWETAYFEQIDEIKQLRSMIERIQVAMSQGQEL
jgi:hypothetical protein